jgi:cytochrome c-type biogenesis protein CcmH/NrfG
MKLGLDEAALAAARKAEEVDPQSPEPPYLRASIHFEAGRRAEARAALEETLERAPGYAPAVQLLEVLEGEGK